MNREQVHILSGGVQLSGHFFEPLTGLPGILFVHGWAGSQERDERRSRAISRLGCICLTFDMRGHGSDQAELMTVTRADNLQDICAAYDVLASHPAVDTRSIAVVASSYGAYLATFLTAMRNVRWLALRVPALYRDEDWDQPKYSLNREDLRAFRNMDIPASANKALAKCQDYAGDVMIVESEHDDLVPHRTITSYIAAFSRARSITYKRILGADHALTHLASRRAYDDILIRWLKDMVFGAR